MYLHVDMTAQFSSSLILLCSDVMYVRMADTVECMRGERR